MLSSRSFHVLFLVVLVAGAPSLAAHCDWVNGPLVIAAKASLDQGDPTPLLRWVPAAMEGEIREAFTRAIAARAAGPSARGVADQWFLETLVRLHRESEGEPFTGLKGVSYRPPAGIALADQALESGSIDSLEKELLEGARAELRKRFAAVKTARDHADHDVTSGREFVRLYADFVHYADALHRSAAGGGSTDEGPHCEPKTEAHAH
jgi:hypothetical protein